MDADAPRVGKVIAGRYRVVERCEQGSAPTAARAARLVDGVEHQSGDDGRKREPRDEQRDDQPKNDHNREDRQV